MSSNNPYRHARQRALPLSVGTTARTVEASTLSLRPDSLLMFGALRTAERGFPTYDQFDQTLDWS